MIKDICGAVKAICDVETVTVVVGGFWHFSFFIALELLRARC